MQATYWVFKGLTAGTVAASINYIHYRDFHGKELKATLILLFPYVLSLFLPQKWLSFASAIPMSAALVLTIPITVSFAWGFHTDPTQDFNLAMVLVLIIAAFVISIIAAAANRRFIKGPLFFAALISSLFYYLAALQYAR